jgi:hypothetical protein
MVQEGIPGRDRSRVEIGQHGDALANPLRRDHQPDVAVADQDHVMQVLELDQVDHGGIS